MIARDVMSSPVITVPRDAPVLEVAGLLTEHRISGVVVVDEDGRALGILGEGDLLYRVARPHLPPHVELLGSIIYLQTPGQIDEMMRKIGGTVAEDVMSHKLASVTEDTPVEDVASLMIDRKIRRIPVVRDGRPVGLITRGDIVRHALAGAIRKHVEAPQSQDISGVSSSEI